MIKLTVTILVLGVCLAAPPAEKVSVPKDVIPIVSQESDTNPDGKYNFA